VGLGGAFSAGKSSLVNALLGRHVLATEVDPTTSLPTYLLNGEAFSVHALNLHGKKIELTHAQFLSLTHDEFQRYGSCVGRLLRAAFVTDPGIPWKHLALIDTPGYSKPDDHHHSARTDAHVARTQLNQANYILWVVSAEAGTIPEKDLQFLASLRPDIPRLVVVSRADKREPADIERIVGLIRRSLEQRNLPCLDVLPISTRRQERYPVQPLIDHLRTWDRKREVIQIPYNFKSKFIEYREFLQQERRDANLQMNRLGRLASLNEAKDVAAFEALHASAKRRLAILAELDAGIATMQRDFFAHLEAVGNTIGLELTEPSDAAMITLKPTNILSLLQDMRPKGSAARDLGKVWHAFLAQHPCANYDQLLQRRSAEHARWLSVLADLVRSRIALQQATAPQDRHPGDPA
jgi:hypothetical protein